MSDIHERLKKLRALAMQGVGGEQAQAQAMLDKLTQKYGVSMEDLEEDKLDKYEFTFKNETEEKLLTQISYKVTNRTDNFFLHKDKRHNRYKEWIECTEAQKVEIDFLFEFYRELWEQECAAFLFAFIQKHRLYGERKEGEGNSKEFSKEELTKMIAMMGVMQDKIPLHQLEEGKK